MKNPVCVPKMTMKSYGEGSPVYTGETQILKKLSELESHYTPYMFSFHMGTTPVIEFSRDGQSARGAWFDHSATNLFHEGTDLRSVPYMVFVGRYMHEFKKIGGRWYLTRFFGEPLLGMADWYLDFETSEGWIKTAEDGSYPEPFSSLEDERLLGEQI